VTNEHEQAARNLAGRFWEELLEIEPLLGTFIGDDRYDDQLPDPTDAGIARRKAFAEGSLASLEGINRSALDVELRTTLDVVEGGSKRELDNIEFRTDRLAAVSHLFGPGNLLASVGSVQLANTPERLAKYLRRLEALGPYLDGICDVVREGADVGETAPALVVDRAIGQMERLLALSPEESPGMTPVESSSDGDRERVSAVIRDVVWPAHARYLDALRAYRPHAREDTIGLLALPNGEAMYAAQIRASTTLDISAQELHDTGVEQLAMIQDERREIAQRLGFPDVASALEAHRSQNYASSREELLRLVTGQVERSWEAAPRFFGRLPKANCEVKPVEEFREDDMPGAFYQPGTPDGERPGAYYVNSGHLESRPLHQTATTSYHEANPGHHFQITIEIEFTDRLPLKRFGGFLVGDSLIEGWGLYSERLADEMGLYLDEYERIGMLEAQGLRACRLIVDTGIHALGWDRERSVRQMQASGASRVDSEIEVDRYISTPGQALAYMTGKLQIDKWRKAAALREGASFSLQNFHDRVLALGSLPLPAVERELSA
jgi:uncharacterized protein (DUF885 family)